MSSPSPPQPSREELTGGLAAIAVGCAEMGATDGDIILTVSNQMSRLDMLTGVDVRDVAAAISRLPQPLNESPEERERRRPIEVAVGLTSPEDQLVASLRAREALHMLAARLEELGR